MVFSKSIKFFAPSFFLLPVMILASYSANAEKITVAIPELPGIVQSSENGTLGGPLVKQLREIELASGHSFELGVYPFPRVVQLVKTGRVDIGVLLRFAKRDKFARPVFQMGITNVVAFGLKGLRLEKPEDFRNMLVGNLRMGTGLVPPYSEQNVILVDYTDYIKGLKMLKARRFEAMITTDYRLLGALKETNTPMSALSKPHTVDQRSFWAYWSKKSDKIGLMDQIQEIGVEIIGERADQSLVNLEEGQR